MQVTFQIFKQQSFDQLKVCYSCYRLITRHQLSWNNTFWNAWTLYPNALKLHLPEPLSLPCKWTWYKGKVSIERKNMCPILVLVT